MSNPKYENIGCPGDKVVEECAELIHAIMKATRFGIDNYHPQNLQSNRELILLEMADVEKAINVYRKVLQP